MRALKLEQELEFLKGENRKEIADRIKQPWPSEISQRIPNTTRQSLNRLKTKNVFLNWKICLRPL